MSFQTLESKSETIKMQNIKTTIIEENHGGSLIGLFCNAWLKLLKGYTSLCCDTLVSSGSYRKAKPGCHFPLCIVSPLLNRENSRHCILPVSQWENIGLFISIVENWMKNEASDRFCSMFQLIFFPLGNEFLFFFLIFFWPYLAVQGLLSWLCTNE